eukprot:m.12403 g.12403  ORF g.12403 m.12403 type:complete len:364 (+) comp8076_c0_seq1:71-1162(+)
MSKTPHTGYLTKRGSLRKTWYKRWCELKDGTLSYYRESGDAKPKGTIDVSLCTCILPAGECRIKWPSAANPKFSFALVILGQRRSVMKKKKSTQFFFHADTQREYDGWMTAIKNHAPILLGHASSIVAASFQVRKAQRAADDDDDDDLPTPLNNEADDNYDDSGDESNSSNQSSPQKDVPIAKPRTKRKSSQSAAPVPSDAPVPAPRANKHGSATQQLEASAPNNLDNNNNSNTSTTANTSQDPEEILAHVDEQADQFEKDGNYEGLALLADQCFAAGRLERGVALYQRAIHACEDNSSLASVLNRVGLAYFDQGRFTEAVSLLDRALAVAEEADCTFSLDNIQRNYQRAVKEQQDQLAGELD